MLMVSMVIIQMEINCFIQEHEKDNEGKREKTKKTKKKKQETKTQLQIYNSNDVQTKYEKK
jgi:hypothetical protein